MNSLRAGPRRFDYPTSVGIFEWSADIPVCAHVALDERSVAALKNRMNQMR